MGFFTKFKGKNRTKTVIVGLDGVPYTMLQDLRDRGDIPNMNSLFNEGYFGQMSVCIPEISSVSWSSFMTGTQSGEHGIFGVMDLNPANYKMFFPNFSNLRAQPLWKDLSAMGKKSVVINMPSTYPAHEINGALISGFVAIDINKAVYPTSLIPRLKEMDYRIDIDTMKARQDPQFLHQDLSVTLENREKAVDFLWKEIDWDLFMVVITGTDRLMHYMWNAYQDDSHEFHASFIEYFNEVDRFVGRLYDRFLNLNGSKKKQNSFLMLSDHGFTGIKSEVYLNRWLAKNDYLKFNSEEPKTIMEIGPNSKAFALDPSRIYINLKDKYQFGTVDKSDYEKVRDEIRQGIEKITFDDGSRVIKQIYNKEELYSGPCLNQAPDLVVLSHHGYDLKGNVTSKKVFGKTDLQGMHTQDDAFMFNKSDEGVNTIFEFKDLIMSNY